MLRTVVVAAALVASAEAFSTPALTGLRMQTGDVQVSRKQVLQSAGALASGVLAAPQLAGAASLDPKTGFPTGSCLPSSGDAGSGCSPVTQAASVLDKQKAVLAGKITVGANKLDQLNAAVKAMAGDGKKKKPKFEKDYVLRFSALYFTPLKNDMIAYAERDVNGAKAAGGAGLPKFNQKTSAPASSSGLYQYVTAIETAMTALSTAAKKEDAAAVGAAGADIQKAALGLLTAANPPIIFN